MLGGIGAGKSHVARALARVAGAEVVDADALASEELVAAGRDGRLADVLGRDAVRADGRPDRTKIAEVVFADPAALTSLEELVHPAVLARVRERLERHREGPGPALLVLDVPLLLETGLDGACDAVWFVEVPEALRSRRAAARGLTPQEVGRREARQAPLARKRERADFVVHNDRDLEPQLHEGLRALGFALEPES